MKWDLCQVVLATPKLKETILSSKPALEPNPQLTDADQLWELQQYKLWRTLQQRREKHVQLAMNCTSVDKLSYNIKSCLIVTITNMIRIPACVIVIIKHVSLAKLLCVPVEC